MKFILSNLLFIISLNISAQYYTGQKVFASKFPQESVDVNMDTYLQITNSNIDIISISDNLTVQRLSRTTAQSQVEAQ